MRCPSCGHENPNGALFCNACGARLETPCPSCGQTNRPGSAFCSNCGGRLADTSSAPTEGRGDLAPTTTQPVSLQGEPSAFGAGRYEVKRFLGEGGKKKVYLAHDTLLDRDVAFALIKTEVLFPRFRLSAEARQAPL